MTDVISLNRVSKKFGRKVILDGLDLTIPRGSVTGLLGKNGAGKTTLLKCLLGLLPIDSGSVICLGESPGSLSAAAKQRIGYVPQVFSEPGWMTVADLLGYTGQFYSAWDSARVERLIADWELDPRCRVSKLSHGQKQRLAIIQAIGHAPEFLVLDEPVASLDPAARRRFIREVLQLNIEAGNTVIFSTHITSDLERAAGHVAFLSGGKVSFNGELDELKESVLRLHVESSELPAKLDLPGLIRVQRFTGGAVLAVRGLDARQVQVLEGLWKARIRIESLNLEEIFLELSQ